jgi:hypothetical protein
MHLVEGYMHCSWSLNFFMVKKIPPWSSKLTHFFPPTTNHWTFAIVHFTLIICYILEITCGEGISHMIYPACLITWHKHVVYVSVWHNNIVTSWLLLAEWIVSLFILVSIIKQKVHNQKEKSVARCYWYFKLQMYETTGSHILKILSCMYKLITLKGHYLP